jgi:hypothetical protein
MPGSDARFVDILPTPSTLVMPVTRMTWFVLYKEEESAIDSVG